MFDLSSYFNVINDMYRLHSIKYFWGESDDTWSFSKLRMWFAKYKF